LTLNKRIFGQAKTPEPLTRGRFLGPILSNQLQGYPGLTPNLDYRTADPKQFVTYFPGLVLQNSVKQHIHFLSKSGGGTSGSPIEVPNPKVLTLEANLPREQDCNSSGHKSLESFGECVNVPFGEVVYARSGDKGSNVNVGFFFPAGDNESEKWEWLRAFLTRDRICGKYIFFSSSTLCLD
jgi:hypothetical protein